MAANSVVGGLIWSNFELIQDTWIIHFLNTCKFEKDRINSNREKVARFIYRRSKADHSVVGGVIWPKFKHIQAFMHALITFTYEKDRMKNSGANMVTSFSPFII